MNFNFEKNVIRTRVRTNFFRKNMPSILRFMAKNDAKGFDWFKNLTSFLAVKRSKVAYFFDQSSCAPSMNIDAGSNTSESWTKVHTLICDPL